jgi:hypothetical protein
MPQPSPDHKDHRVSAEELQVQRERLRQAFLGDARLEDVADLMNAMHALLPTTPSKRTRPRRQP